MSTSNRRDSKPNYDPHFPYQIPTSRLAAILQDWLDKHGAETTDPDNVYGLYKAAAMTGISARRLYYVLHEEGPTVLFHTADRILCGLDLVDLWHIAPENGGLADWYEANDDNPLPALPTATPRQQAIARRSNTARKKAAARRAQREAAAA